MYVVYCHTNHNNRKAYVGWALMAENQAPSKAMARRWETHCAAAARGAQVLFSRAIRKHGASAFDHELLEVMTTIDGAKRAEQLWIAERKSYAFDLDGWGYNMTKGGDGMVGLPYTEDRRKKVIASNRQRLVTAETRAKHRSNRLGTKRPTPYAPETLKAFSDAKLGAQNPNAKLTEESVTQIRSLFSQGVTNAELARRFKVTRSTISNVISRKVWKHVA